MTEAYPVDHARIERAVREILAAVGEDPDREGLLETPARVARMYAEMFSGLRQDPRVHRDLLEALAARYHRPWPPPPPTPPRPPIPPRFIPP